MLIDNWTHGAACRHIITPVCHSRSIIVERNKGIFYSMTSVNAIYWVSLIASRNLKWLKFGFKLGLNSRSSAKTEVKK